MLKRYQQYIEHMTSKILNTNYGAGMIYELWESRCYAEIRRFLATLKSQEEVDYAISLFGTNGEHAAAEDPTAGFGGWKCSECEAPLDEWQLVTSMSLCCEALCSTCLSPQFDAPFDDPDLFLANI